MAQNKTTLILNNLVELTYPLKSSKQVQITSQGNFLLDATMIHHILDQSQQIELTVVLPFQALLQKVDLGYSSKTKI